MKIAVKEDTGEVIEQKTAEWYEARLGKVTASEVHNVVTPGKLQAAAGHGYLKRLAAEICLGEPIDTGDTIWTERGTQLEDASIRWYEFDHSVTVERVGFIESDCGRFGCSPDGLVGEDGGLEAKNPSAVVHVGYLIDDDALYEDHFLQVQFGLYVTKRKWWDLMSFNEKLPKVVVRCLPDPTVFAAFDKHLPPFLARLDAAVAKIEARRSLNPFE